MKKFPARSIFVFFLIYGQWILAAVCILAVFNIFTFAQNMSRPERVDVPVRAAAVQLLGDVLNTLWILALIAIAVCLAWAYLSWYFYRYEMQEKSLHIENGVLIKNYVNIPYERMQNIDIQRSVLYRLLGVSDVKIETAGKNGVVNEPEGRLIAVSASDAEKIKNELLSRVKDDSGI